MVVILLYSNVISLFITYNVIGKGKTTVEKHVIHTIPDLEICYPKKNINVYKSVLTPPSTVVLLIIVSSREIIRSIANSNMHKP